MIDIKKYCKNREFNVRYTCYVKVITLGYKVLGELKIKEMACGVYVMFQVEANEDTEVVNFSEIENENDLDERIKLLITRVYTQIGEQVGIYYMR